MRIYETSVRGWSEEEGKIQRWNTGKEEDQSRHSFSGHPWAHPFLPLSSSSSFVCLITGCILSPCFVYLKFMSFFSSSVICQKNVSSVISEPTLCLSLLAAFSSMSLNNHFRQTALHLTPFMHYSSSYISSSLHKHAELIHVELI